MEQKTYTELSVENRITLFCVFISWMIEALIGMDFFWNNQDKYSAVDAVLFFVLMYIPWIIACVIYRRNKNSLKVSKKHLVFVFDNLVLIGLQFCDVPDIMLVA